MSASPYVFEVQAATFKDDVVLKSQEVPVLLDFWAEWCGPCRTLTPVLESLADEYAGGFLLGKVNTEVERELAAAFQVQSIPFVILISDGRPVDGFNGALPEPEVRRFLETLGIQPGAGSAPADQEPEEDPDSPAARFRAGLTAALTGDAGTARERLEGIQEEDDESDRAARVLAGLRLFEADLASLPPGEATTRLAAGKEALLAGHLESAAEEFLASVAADKSVAEGLARHALVLTLEGFADEDTANEMRRRLATLLY